MYQILNKTPIYSVFSSKPTTSSIPVYSIAQKLKIHSNRDVRNYRLQGIDHCFEVSSISSLKKIIYLIFYVCMYSHRYSKNTRQ